MDMAKQGLLASAVVISDPDYANSLKANCPWMTIVFRQVWTDHDPLPNLNGEEAHDRIVARNWYHGPLHFHTLRCRKDVYIQLVNEQSYPWDGYFNDELMAQAEMEGYRLALPHDSGGAPGDQDGMRALWYTATGQVQSDFFVPGRKKAILRMTRNSHIYAWHSYGDITDGKYHRSDDPDRWPWFSGRTFELMRLIAPEDRPKTLITEFGSGATQFTESMGFNALWGNYKGFVDKAVAMYPDQMSNCLGICQWTFGSPGFPGQDVQQWIPKMIEQQRKVL